MVLDGGELARRLSLHEIDQPQFDLINTFLEETLGNKSTMQDFLTNADAFRIFGQRVGKDPDDHVELSPLGQYFVDNQILSRIATSEIFQNIVLEQADGFARKSRNYATFYLPSFGYHIQIISHGISKVYRALRPDSNKDQIFDAIGGARIQNYWVRFFIMP